MGSRSKTVLTFVLVILLFSNYSMGGSRETPDPVWFEIKVPKKVYEMDDLVVVTIHIFYEGEYSEVETIEVAESTYYGNHSVLEPVPRSKGIWECSYRIEEYHLESYWGIVSVNVTIDGREFLGGHSFVFDPTEEQEELTITHTIEPAGVMVDADDVRTITYEVRYNGALVDPTKTWLELRWESMVFDQPDFERISRGRYRVAIDMSEVVKPFWYQHSQVFDVYLRVEYQSSPGSNRVSDTHHVYLYLNFLHVWVRQVEPTDDDQMTFEFYATSIEGRPMEDAIVEMHFGPSGYDGRWSGETFHRNLTLDEDGRGKQTFPMYDPLLEASRIRFWGKVHFGWILHELEFFIERPEQPPAFAPAGWGCDFELLSDPVFRPGLDESFTARVYSDGEPWTGETHYLVTTEEEVLANGRVIPDYDGSVTVEFHTPLVSESPYVQVTFTVKVETPDINWYRSKDRWYGVADTLGHYEMESVLVNHEVLIDDRIVFENASLLLGTPSLVSYHHPEPNASWENWIVATFTSDRIGDVTGGGWTYASESPIPGTYADSCGLADGALEGYVYVPPGLPGEDIVLMAIMVDREGINLDGHRFSERTVRVGKLTDVETEVMDTPWTDEDADLSVVGSDEILGVSPTRYRVLALATIILLSAGIILLFRRTRWGGDLPRTIRYGLVTFLLSLVLVLAAIPGSEYEVVHHGSFEPIGEAWPIEPVHLESGEYTVWVEDPGVLVFDQVPVDIDVREISEGWMPTRPVRSEIAGLDCALIIGFDANSPGNYTIWASANPEVVEMSDIDVFVVREASLANRIGLMLGFTLLIMSLGLMAVPLAAKRFQRRSDPSVEDTA